jgi:uncharacterized protein
MRKAILFTGTTRSFFFALAGLGLVGVGLTGCGHHHSAHQPGAPHVVAVVGEGEVSSAPDLGTVRLGVEERALTADDAMRRANERMTAVMNAVKSKGVSDKDLQTTDLSVYFERTHEAPPYPVSREAIEKETSLTKERAVGSPVAPDVAVTHETPQGFYVVRNTVIVSVRQLEKLGEVIGAAMQAGANHLYGLELTIDNPRPLQKEARNLAVKEALEKARALAKEADVKLGQVIEITEIDGQPVTPYFAKRSMAVQDSSVPI